MKQKKGHLLVISIFIIYLFFADFIFNDLIKVEGEFPRVTIDLPEETSDILMGWDEINERKDKWKDTLYIQGWAFRVDNQISEKSRNDTYIVLYSEKEQYLFGADVHYRKDVIEHFNIEEADVGFNSLISRNIIKDGVYRLGIVINNDIDKKFSLSDRYISKIDNRLYLGYVSELKHITKINETHNIKYGLDILEEKEDAILHIKGWSFLEDIDAKNNTVDIVFKSNNNTYFFGAVSNNRKDVTEYFSNLGLDLDNSGFEAIILKERIEPGNSQIGICVRNGGSQGLIFSDKYYNID